MSALRLFFAALLVAVLAPACSLIPSDVEPPIVSVIGIGELQAGAFEQRFRIDLRLQNPNSFDLALDGVDFQLDLNGRRLTRGLSGEPVTVPRLGEAQVSVPATTTVLDLLRQLTPREGGGEGLRYEIRGRALLSGSSRWLPFEASGELLQ